MNIKLSKAQWNYIGKKAGWGESAHISNENGMKVKDLINELNKFDPELMVVLDSGEIGVEEIKQVSLVNLNLNAITNPKSWEGPHDEDPSGKTLAVKIFRKG